MNKGDDNTNDYRSFLLLDEISKNEEMTQRDMSNKLGVALGLVNSYLKNLASKGYITISGIPRKRYRYYLTPSGFKEKARLTYHHLHNFTSLYRVARKDFHSLFREIDKAHQINKTVFCGVDEITEIAYLSLKEVGLELSAVLDDIKIGNKFFGMNIQPIKEINSIDYDVIIITSFNKGEALVKELTGAGISEDKICDISKGGWLNKI